MRIQPLQGKLQLFLFTHYSFACTVNSISTKLSNKRQDVALFNIDGNVPLLQEETKVQLALGKRMVELRTR